MQEEEDIVSDYAKKIQQVRLSNKLNQDQFAQKLNEKPSLMRRIESGKAKPTIQLAKKIEKMFNISLLTKSDSTTDVNYKNYIKKKVEITSRGIGSKLTISLINMFLLKPVLLNII